MMFRELGQNASTQWLGVESSTLNLLIEMLNRENSDKIRVLPCQKGKIQETSQKGGPQNVRVGTVSQGSLRSDDGNGNGNGNATTRWFVWLNGEK